MAASPDPTYTVDYLSRALEQLRSCIDALPSKQDRKECFSVNHGATLRRDPLQWGDPEYGTKKEGGSVCHGVMHPFLVRYVVYELEKAVCILSVESVA